MQNTIVVIFFFYLKNFYNIDLLLLKSFRKVAWNLGSMGSQKTTRQTQSKPQLWDSPTVCP